MTARFKILILGGTGTFGGRIYQRLSRAANLQVIVAGRTQSKIDACVAHLRQINPAAGVDGYVLTLPDTLAQALLETGAQLVIDACGPFQGQNTEIAETCIHHGVHYIDIADDRDFVRDIDRLDQAAKLNGVLVISGASTVPCLSSAVVADLAEDLADIHAIAIGIVPGNRQPRGRAVVEAILSYVGQPIPRRQNGEWRHVHGWQDLRRRTLRGLGVRWFAACDVPDTVLLANLYPSARTITFHAGLELSLLHFGLWALSWLVRWRVISSLRPYAETLRKISTWLDGFGSDSGGMFVEVTGTECDGTPSKRLWTLIAEAGDGPWIPTIPAVLLARKIADRALAETGAMPCLNMITLEDFAAEVSDLSIKMEVTDGHHRGRSSNAAYSAASSAA